MRKANDQALYISNRDCVISILMNSEQYFIQKYRTNLKRTKAPKEVRSEPGYWTMLKSLEIFSLIRKVTLAVSDITIQSYYCKYIVKATQGKFRELDKIPYVSVNVNLKLLTNNAQ